MSLIKNLSESERRTIKWGSIATVFLLYMVLIVLPLKDKEEDYKRLSGKMLKIAERVRAMSREYRGLTKRFEELKSANPQKEESFTLFSFLDKVATDSGLKKNIKGMKPSIQAKEGYTESTVAVELEDVQIKPLTEYIHLVESSGQNIMIKKVDIKPRYSNPDRINVNLIISAIAIN
ncbi:MAG: type II secretion system protein GspM [Deltaproteobacteria bacterium]|nr:type II secretion system protein GspM [Deltaproteobacteria bacterium]